MADKRNREGPNSRDHSGGCDRKSVRMRFEKKKKTCEKKNDAFISANRLTLSSINRDDLGTTFTCQAVNTKLVKPKDASVVLDLNRK